MPRGLDSSDGWFMMIAPGRRPTRPTPLARERSRRRCRLFRSKPKRTADSRHALRSLSRRRDVCGLAGGILRRREELGVCRGRPERQCGSGDDVFVATPLRARLLSYAERVGAPPALRLKAAELMQQPHGTLPHDGHFHLRISCPVHMTGCVDNPASRPPRSAVPEGAGTARGRRRMLG